MPTLEEVIRDAPPDKRIFIEMKVGAHAVPALQSVIQRSDRPAKDLSIISFDFDCVRAAKLALPQCTFYWLVAPSATKPGNGGRHQRR